MTTISNALSARARRSGVLLKGSLSIVALATVLALLTLLPLGMLFYGSLSGTPPGERAVLTASGYLHLFSGRTAAVLLETAWLSGVTTAASLVVAILLAVLVARTDLPARGVFDVLLTLPFFMPPILTAMAWGMLGNAQAGSINLVWRALTGSDTALVNLYSRFGVVWHLSQYAVPFLLLMITDAFRTMDPSLEEASQVSGAAPWTTFRRVTLAVLLPVLSSAFLLSFIRGCESFESALIFGAPAGIQVLTTAIYDAINQNTDPDYAGATALAFAAMALILVLVLGQWRLLGKRQFQTVTGKARAPRQIPLGRWRWPAFGLCLCVVMVMTLLPLGQLVVGSLFQYFGFYTLDMLTLDHWHAVLGDAQFWRATRNTLVLAFGGASLTMLLGTLAAYAVVRTQSPLRRAVDLLAWLPWIMPGMVLGLGFLWCFASLPGLRLLYGTIWALLIAYVTLGTPLAMRVMSGSLQQITADLEECSRVHGAGFWTTLRRILLALCYPAFAVGWILTFFMIIRELSASILLYGPDTQVLSVFVLRLWSGGKAEECSVIALLMILLVLVFRGVQLFLFRRWANRV